MQVLIHNTSKEDYSELYEGEVRTIKAGEAWETDNATGRKFIGTMPPVKTDKFGNTFVPDKPLQLERIGQPEEDTSETYISNKDGREFSTGDALIKHLEKHSASVLRDIEAEKKTTKTYCCLLCKFETTAKVALMNHMKAHDNKKEIEDDTEQDKGASKGAS